MVLCASNCLLKAVTVPNLCGWGLTASKTGLASPSDLGVFCGPCCEVSRQVEANFQGRCFLFPSQLTAHASQALRATGVAIPPTLREIQ
jgi:hypothetical protein